MHDVTQESVASMTDNFAHTFVRKNVHAYKRSCGNVMPFENLMLTPFCFEKSSVRKWISNVLRDIFSAVYAEIR